jgi:hypothetical protein
LDAEQGEGPGGVTAGMSEPGSDVGAPGEEIGDVWSGLPVLGADRGGMGDRYPNAMDPRRFLTVRTRHDVRSLATEPARCKEMRLVKPLSGTRPRSTNRMLGFFVTSTTLSLTRTSPGPA